MGLTDTKKMFGKLLGELYRNNWRQMTQDERRRTTNRPAKIYGLLNGFEHVIDEAISTAVTSDVFRAVDNFLVKADRMSSIPDYHQLLSNSVAHFGIQVTETDLLLIGTYYKAQDTTMWDLFFKYLAKGGAASYDLSEDEK